MYFYTKEGKREESRNTASCTTTTLLVWVCFCDLSCSGCTVSGCVNAALAQLVSACLMKSKFPCLKNLTIDFGLLGHRVFTSSDVVRPNDIARHLQVLNERKLQYLTLAFPSFDEKYRIVFESREALKKVLVDCCIAHRIIIVFEREPLDLQKVW